MIKLQDIPKVFEDAFKMDWTPAVIEEKPVELPPVHWEPGADTLTLEVTQKHINAGVPGHPSHCAVALALRELVGPDWNIQVRGSGVGFLKHTANGYPGRYVSYSGGPGLHNFVRNFDLQGTRPPVTPKPATIVLNRTANLHSSPSVSNYIFPYSASSV